MPFNKIIAESMDLTDTYAFTGTVSGTGKVLQMKSVQGTSAVSINSESFTNLTSMAITFSPISASSIILFQISASVNGDHGDVNQGMRYAYTYTLHSRRIDKIKAVHSNL